MHCRSGGGTGCPSGNGSCLYAPHARSMLPSVARRGLLRPDYESTIRPVWSVATSVALIKPSRLFSVIGRAPKWLRHARPARRMRAMRQTARKVPRIPEERRGHIAPCRPGSFLASPLNGDFRWNAGGRSARTGEGFGRASNRLGRSEAVVRRAFRGGACRSRPHGLPPAAH